MFIQEIRERNRSMSLIIRDLKNGSNRPVSPGTVIVSQISYANLVLVSLGRNCRKSPQRSFFRTAMKMGEGLNETEIAELIENVDPRQSGKIMYEPFCAYILSK